MDTFRGKSTVFVNHHVCLRNLHPMWTPSTFLPGWRAGVCVELTFTNLPIPENSALHQNLTLRISYDNEINPQFHLSVQIEVTFPFESMAAGNVTAICNHTICLTTMVKELTALPLMNPCFAGSYYIHQLECNDAIRQLIGIC